MSQVPIHTRRELLTHGLGLVGVGATLPNFLVRSSLAASKEDREGRIVVSLLLEGGPDGMSLAIPHGHDEYYKLRPKLGYDKTELIQLNDEIGLHPRLTGFKALLDKGQMALVLGTAFPNNNLSHFVARDYWEAGNIRDKTGTAGSAGWLGRYLDHAFPDEKSPTRNVAVVPRRFPLILTGQKHPGIGLDTPDSFAYTGQSSEKELGLYRKLSQLPVARPLEDLQFITRTGINANTASERIRELASRYSTPVQYPDTQFGRSVRTIAALINGGLDGRAYYAAQGIAVFGGYDTHANQKGRLNALLGELNQTVSAFYEDLARCSNDQRVLTMTFAEFGRRAKENYSGGTDHGWAQPMFLFGPGVKPGVHGTQASLTDLDKNGNLKMAVDFRRVYASILEKWLHTPSEVVLGEKFPPLEVIA
ncbi:MAG: DUF1501 domain-containing protein [Pirellulaceae bacterium]|nr:DUF1501 domain-containing protein [Pirellulaceae bacterium]HJN13005.1 DUF1501 domain-containing protein [Pirellulaceae bacterium]